MIDLVSPEDAFLGPADFESYHHGFDVGAYLHGKAFFEAAGKLDGGYHENHVQVAMQAFAIEVLLKSMQSTHHIKQIYKQGDQPGQFVADEGKSFSERKFPMGGHDVFKVFEKLDEPLRLAMGLGYKSEFNRELETDLKEIGTLFADLRYLYEEDSFSYQPQQVTDVAEFLIGFIEKNQNTGLFQIDGWTKAL